MKIRKKMDDTVYFNYKEPQSHVALYSIINEIETMNQKLRNMSLSLSTFTKYHLGTTTQL